jgi:hypothetical protein
MLLALGGDGCLLQYSTFMHSVLSHYGSIRFLEHHRPGEGLWQRVAYAPSVED